MKNLVMIFDEVTTLYRYIFSALFGATMRGQKFKPVIIIGKDDTPRAFKQDTIESQDTIDSEEEIQKEKKEESEDEN